MNSFTATSNNVSYPFVSTSYEAPMQPEAFVALDPQAQQYQLLRQNPQYQFQPHQINQQGHQQIAHPPIQQPIFDFNSPQHLPPSQHSPTESISNAFEAYPPHLSNSPESGLSVRSNSPSAAGSPRLGNNSVAPGLQASRGTGVVPTFIHQDSYGSDQSQSYDTMYNPVTTASEKTGGFVGESNKLSHLPFSSLSSQHISEPSFTYPQFFYEHSFQNKVEDYASTGKCLNENAHVREIGVERQHMVRSDCGRADLSFHGTLINAVSYGPEIPQNLEKSKNSTAERCNFPNTNLSDYSFLLPSEQAKTRSSCFSPSLEEIPEFLSHSSTQAKNCEDVIGLQNMPCSSPFRNLPFSYSITQR